MFQMTENKSIHTVAFPGKDKRKKKINKKWRLNIGDEGQKETTTIRAK